MPGDITLLYGDCLEQLRALPANGVDALVTDPPAGIGFMGVAWDSFSTPKGAARTEDGWDWTGSRERPRTADQQTRVTRNQGRAFRAFLTPILEECHRVLKPGAHGLVWALPRTSHWTATALEDAGFEVRDVITHHFGTGFPKGKSALKPASEHWILVRKPLAAPNVAANVAAFGTGAINIDAGRIGTRADSPQHRPASPSGAGNGGTCYSARNGQEATYTAGRWPPNVVLSHTPDCVPVGSRQVPNNARRSKARPGSEAVGYDGGWQQQTRPWGSAGAETVEAWECAPDCPVGELDRQSGILHSGAVNYGAGQRVQSNWRTNEGRPDDQVRGTAAHFPASVGGASRFFPTFRYAAKASTGERNAGSATTNRHPTVKSQALMSWLIALITPPGGTILDCFMGSGSTGVAARTLGFGFIGCEQDAEYFAIAQARIADPL